MIREFLLFVTQEYLHLSSNAQFGFFYLRGGKSPGGKGHPNGEKPGKLHSPGQAFMGSPNAGYDHRDSGLQQKFDHSGLKFFQNTVITRAFGKKAYHFPLPKKGKNSFYRSLIDFLPPQGKSSQLMQEKPRHGIPKELFLSNEVYPPGRGTPDNDGVQITGMIGKNKARTPPGDSNLTSHSKMEKKLQKKKG
jgi:hypothetical protein